MSLDFDFQLLQPPGQHNLPCRQLRQWWSVTHSSIREHTEPSFMSQTAGIHKGCPSSQRHSGCGRCCLSTMMRVKNDQTQCHDVLGMTLWENYVIDFKSGTVGFHCKKKKLIDESFHEELIGNDYQWHDLDNRRGCLCVGQRLGQISSSWRGGNIGDKQALPKTMATVQHVLQHHCIQLMYWSIPIQ